jgi:hypothetical protein
LQFRNHRCDWTFPPQVPLERQATDQNSIKIQLKNHSLGGISPGRRLASSTAR